MTDPTTPLEAENIRLRKENNRLKMIVDSHAENMELAMKEDRARIDKLEAEVKRLRAELAGQKREE